MVELPGVDALWASVAAYTRDQARRIMAKDRTAYLKQYRADHKEARKVALQAWRTSHKEERNAKAVVYSNSRRDKVNQSAFKYRTNHSAECKARADAWFALHPEYKHSYRVANRVRFNALAAKRRAAQMHATPPWLTEQHFEAIEQFYVEAARLQAVDGIQRHVDHIYPLQGKTVCGLHVPWNLQVLTATANMHKSARVITVVRS